MKKILFSLLLSPYFLMASEGMEAEYKAADSDLAAKRVAENKAQDEFWVKEDKAKAAVRLKQGFFERAFHTMATDGANDAETEKARNIIRLDTSRERLQQDLKIQSEQIATFRKNNEEINKDPRLKSLLDLADMKTFMEKSPEERAEFVKNIKTSLLDLQDTSISPKALSKLIKFSKSCLKLPEEATKALEALDTTSQIEVKSLAQTETTTVKVSLHDALKSSLDEQIKALEAFNDEINSTKEDIKSIKNVRLLKNIGIIAFLVLGTVAGILLLAHGAIIIGPIVLGMEAFAIAAKVGFLVFHKASHAENEKSIKIQNDFLDATAKLMPETTKLLRAEAYESNAKTLTERIDLGINNLLGDDGKKYYQTAKENINKAAKSIGDFNKKIAKSFADSITTSYSEGKQRAKSKAPAVVSDADFQEFNVGPAKPTAQVTNEKSGDGDNAPYQVPA
ncbi:MAG: hypothetical protein NTU89_00770 [Candidatus Dependentiae bacterium]|nr:hypothetical protein [Candidatus Dependentiae bacterium]